jgi:transposase
MHQSLSVAVDEAVKRRRPYKKISLEQKLAVVRTTFEPGMSVSRVARRFDVNANLVFRWRKMYADEAARRPAPTSFVPVEIVKPVATAAKLPALAIELDGGVRLRIDAGLDEAALARVIAAVRASS